MKPKAFIECDDYKVGEFTPISFTPKLKWKIIKSEFIKSSTKLPKHIVLKARLANYPIVLASYPHSFGLFDVHTSGLRFGRSTNQLDTNDPEEAIYIVEQELFKWATAWSAFYQQIADRLVR
jgi:hypothetical protein